MSCRVLIVEDHKPLRRLMHIWLRDVYEVIEAASMQEAMVRARSTTLNLAVLEDEERTLETSIKRSHPSHAMVARNLAATLDKLDALIDTTAKSRHA